MRRGTGSITRLARNRWRVRVMVDGVRRSVNVTGTRADAEARLNALSAQMRGEPCADAETTVAGFWRDFMASCEVKGLAPSTLAGYERTYRNHVEPELGPCRLTEVTPRMVSRLLGSKTAGTARHVKALLSAMFSYAEELELVEVSVMRRKYTMPKGAARTANRDVMDLDTMRAVADLAEGEPWEAYFLMMAFAGLRREEAAAVRPEDIREYRGRAVIDVRRTYQMVDGRGVIGTGKTTGSVRTAVMVERGERLLELRDSAGEWMTMQGGDIANPDSVSKKWEAWFKRQPFAYVPMRNLRPSFSTAMMAAGMDSALVSKLTGHASMDVQYRHYLRPEVDDFIDALAPIGPGGASGVGPNETAGPADAAPDRGI